VNPSLTGPGSRGTRFFRDLSIGRKLTLITSSVSLAALLLTGAAFVAYELVRFRGDVTAELETLADVIGTNSAGAVLFDDIRTAEEVLGALTAVEHIESAAIYGPNGALFAQYAATDPATSEPPVTVELGVTTFDGHLAVLRPLTLNGEVLGSVYIRSDMRQLRARITQYVGIMAVAMLASFLLVIVLSARLQRVVSGPIKDLVVVAERISRENDYSIRVEQRSSDETGMLVQAFNTMLERIEGRDAALIAAMDEARRLRGLKALFSPR
jgi:HAMP domain-containing protein